MIQLSPVEEVWSDKVFSICPSPGSEGFLSLPPPPLHPHLPSFLSSDKAIDYPEPSRGGNFSSGALRRSQLAK